MTVKRFTLRMDQRDGPWWQEAADGHWVRYADHVAELERMEEAHADDLREQGELDDLARGDAQ